MFRSSTSTSTSGGDLNSEKQAKELEMNFTLKPTLSQTEFVRDR